MALTMNFSRILPRYTRLMMLIALLLFLIHSASSLDCSPSTGSLTCDCTATSIECSGSQTNISNVEEVLTLANNLRMDTVVLKINDLRFEPSFVFGNTSIRNLTLGYGFQIPSLNFFSGIPSLVSLNLQNNSIREIHEQLFSTLSDLKELYLDENNLEDLTANMFVHLTNLSYLSMTRNNILEIKSDVFQNLSALKTLILSHNNISSIENVKMISTSLIDLQISHCLIKGALEKDTFSNIPNLGRLDMSHNKLSEVKPHSLSTLKDLQFLDLSYNSIKHLHDFAFSGMKNLTYLDLKGNGISVIRLTSFASLHNLKHLDLSANNLTAVLCEYTTDFGALETIYLQDNKIKSFAPGAFFYSPNLAVFNLSGNNLECSCPLTDTALYLIENSTMRKEDLEHVPCVIPSTRSTAFITESTSSKCPPPEPCKNPDTANSESEDDEYYDYTDVNEGNTTISTNNETASTPLTTKSVTASLMVSISNATTPNTSSDTSETAESTTESTIVPITNATAPITASDTPETTESTTESITVSIMNATTPNPSSHTFGTTESTIENATISIMNATALNTASDTPETTDSTTENARVSIMKATTPNTAPNTSETTVSITESTTASIMNATSSTTASSLPETTVPTTESTTESTENATTTIIASVAPVTAVTVIKSTTSPKMNASTTEIASTALPTNTRSNVSTVSSCSSLDLSIPSLTSDSEFEVFKNFSYDGSTFCLKWTIAGNLKSVKKCVIKYSIKKGNPSKPLKCPLVANEIKTWSVGEDVFRVCLDIYAPKKISFCKTTVDLTTAPIPTEIITPVKTETTAVNEVYSSTALIDNYNFTSISELSTTLDLSTGESSSVSESEVIPLSTTDTTLSKSSSEQTTILEIGSVTSTSESVKISSPFSIIALNVYFNNSNLAFATWAVNTEVSPDKCHMTLKATTQYFDYKEGVFPCKNNSHQLRNVKETDIFKVCIVSHHATSGNLTECTLSVSPALESKSKKNEDDELNGSLIPVICLLILLGIIVMFIVLKNIFKKKQESLKYDVRAEEVKYEQRAKERPISTNDQSMRFSYITRDA